MRSNMLLQHDRATIRLYMREWVDVETSEYDTHSFEVTKERIRLLRHDRSVLREQDRAVEHNALGQVESCSEERIDALSNEIQRDHPSQHSASSVY